MFTADEMDAVKFIAQGHRCQQGLKCKNASCYYGHRCQVHGICNGQNCAFLPEEHDPGKYKPVLVSQQLPVHTKGPAGGPPAGTAGGSGKNNKAQDAGGKGAGGKGAGGKGAGGKGAGGNKPQDQAAKGPKKNKGLSSGPINLD